MNQLEGKVILITGASGFIGTHLAKRLSTVANATLLLLSRRERQSTQANTTWFKGDLKELTKEYWHSRNIGQIDHVLHLGGFTPKQAVDANCVAGVIDDNILGTCALLNSLPGKQQRIVFSSTLDVYSPSGDDAVITEESKVEPRGLYGASKFFCEHLVSTWATKHGSKYSILRYGHIYGPGEEAYEKIIPVAISKLLLGQSPTVWGNGSTLRDYLNVSDVVEATIRSAIVDFDIEPTNVVRGESVTVKHDVQLLVQLSRRNTNIEFLSHKPNASSLRFKNSRMKKMLGVWPLMSLEEGLMAELESQLGCL